MSKYKLPGTIQIDHYGLKPLLPVLDNPPEDSIFLAGAGVWLEAIWSRENYWLQIDGDTGTYRIWNQIEEIGDRYTCCVRFDQEDDSSPEDVAQWLLTALWYSRVSQVMAMTLGHFEVEGMLPLSKLDDLADAYHSAISKPKVPDGAIPEFGEIFYETGELKYRGEHWQEVAHGKGMAYWENGNVWCDGFFINHQPHGYCRMFTRDGNLKFEGNLENGLPKGPGREFNQHGQVRFEGIFGRQSIYYGYGCRVYEKGRLYDNHGGLIHDGEFQSDGKRSWPVKVKKGVRS